MFLFVFGRILITFLNRYSFDSATPFSIITILYCTTIWLLMKKILVENETNCWHQRPKCIKLSANLIVSLFWKYLTKSKQNLQKKSFPWCTFANPLKWLFGHLMCLIFWRHCLQIVLAKKNKTFYMAIETISIGYNSELMHS